MSAASDECSIRRVQHQTSAASDECSIRRVQHQTSAASDECSIRRVQHQMSAAFSQVQHLFVSFVLAVLACMILLCVKVGGEIISDILHLSRFMPYIVSLQGYYLVNDVIIVLY